MKFIYFAIVLGITIFIHELGHFLFAKRAGIYVHEFSLGMGPRLFKFRRKNDETEYSLRLFPIGGFVRMAGEEIEEDRSVPENRRLQAKGWVDRFLTIIAGVMFNFILTIVLFFMIALFMGAPELKPYIDKIEENYPAANTELQPGDLVLKVNKTRVRSRDMLRFELLINKDKPVILQVKDTAGKIKNIKITPKKEVQNDVETYIYGFSLVKKEYIGFFPSIKFAFVRTFDLIEQMFFVLKALFIGRLGLDSLAGPIGILNIVGEVAKVGIVSLLEYICFLSINVGVINLLPIPAFDGGRVLFLIVEKIKGKPIDPKVENIIHAVGFVILMLLMLFVTYNDILRLFK